MTAVQKKKHFFFVDRLQYFCKFLLLIFFVTHVGVSVDKYGRERVNAFSIGIELVNKGGILFVLLLFLPPVPAHPLPSSSYLLPAISTLINLFLPHLRWQAAVSRCTNTAIATLIEIFGKHCRSLHSPHLVTYTLQLVVLSAFLCPFSFLIMILTIP